MMMFWLASAAMVAAALAFVIPPLMRATTIREPSREQANLNIYRERLAELEQQEKSAVLDATQSASARDDLDREMLAQFADSPADPAPQTQQSDSRPWRAIVIAVLLPLLAVGIYLQVGEPRTLFDQSATTADSPAAGDPGQPSIAQMVARLEQRLQAQPDDVRGWLMLGRSYSVMNRNEDARVALAKALALAPDDAEVMVGYAQVLTTLNKGSLQGEPIALVNRALSIEADNPRALWLAGVHALNQGIPSQALSSWQRVLDSGQLDAAASAQVLQAMSSVRAALADAQDKPQDKTADTASAGAEPGRTATAATAQPAVVQVNVSLSPQLSARVTGTETLFVFARASKGPPMPVAVQRLTASQLPTTVVLDDSSSMAPELALSRFDSVIVTARISRTGTPRAGPGDLQGNSLEVATRNGEAVDLIIDQLIE